MAFAPDERVERPPVNAAQFRQRVGLRRAVPAGGYNHTPMSRRELTRTRVASGLAWCRHNRPYRFEPLALREVPELAERVRRVFILNRRTFATLPQSLITHQRRLWFFVESTNSHPHVPPSHRRTCSNRCGDVSRSAA